MRRPVVDLQRWRQRRASTQEGEYVVEDTVWESADAVGAGRGRRTVALLPRRHFVEQATFAVGSARQQKVKRGWREWGGRDRCMSSAHLSCLVTACKSESMPRHCCDSRARRQRRRLDGRRAAYPRTRDGRRRTRAGAGRPSPRTGAGRRRPRAGAGRRRPRTGAGGRAAGGGKIGGKGQAGRRNGGRGGWAAGEAARCRRQGRSVVGRRGGEEDGKGKNKIKKH
jgi:hypothetical protein